MVLEFLQYLCRSLKCDLHQFYSDYDQIAMGYFNFLDFYFNILRNIFLGRQQYLIVCCRAVSSSQVVHDWQRRHDCIFFPIIIKGFFLSLNWWRRGGGGEMPKWRAGDDIARVFASHRDEQLRLYWQWMQLTTAW